MEFITVGEMVIDFLPGKEKGSYIRNAGGAPANVAIAAVRNGVSAGIYCKLGNDDFGKFLYNILLENSVKPLVEKFTDKAITTMAFVSLNEENERSFTFARKPGADMMLEQSEIKDEDIKKCKLLQAGSCTLSAGNAIAATKYAMKRAYELKKMVGFDINYRSLMWDDDKDSCIKEVYSIMKYVDFLKMSDEEVEMIGGSSNIINVMNKYNITVVVLTLGSEGAELFYKEERYLIPGFKADVVADTTGAGDAFWGGFLSYILNQGIICVEELNVDILKSAVVYGNVSGLLAVQEKGAIASLPTKEKIIKYLERKKDE